MDAIILGGGIFGVAAARELRQRGHTVRIVNPEPIPSTEAESNDISKVVRLDYGADDLYRAWMEEALPRWRGWPFFHETGIQFSSRDPLVPGGFEYEARARVAGAEASRECGLTGMPYGYFNPQGGWAESGRVTAWLAEGIPVVAGAMGVEEALRSADHVVVAVGAWTQTLLPELPLRATAQTIFHLVPRDPSAFQYVYCADISRTGWYGFPVHPSGVVKIANHGPGRAVDPRAPRSVTAEEIAAMWGFVRAHLPALVGAELVYTRACVYGDSPDGHLWIARHPENARLTVAAGGSGHSFKFAPVLGDVIADTVEGKVHRMSERFRWRTAGDGGGEGARAR